MLSDICNIATVNLGWYRRSFRSLIWGDEESAVFYIIDNYIFIKLYEKELNEQQNGTFVKNFDDSYLFVCTHIQQKKLDGDNYFLTLNLLNIDDNYNLLFVEGDFDKCTVTVLKRYILSENQFEKWKKIICSSFECEVLKDFSNNKYFDDEKNLHNEFIKFLESIRYQ